MSWEMRLAPWSIIISVFCQMWNLLHSELSWPSPLLFVFIWCTVTCGLAHAWHEHASVPKAFAWEVEGPKYVCSLFSKSTCGETHARRCFFLNSQRSNGQIFLKFYEKLAMGKPSRLPPNSSKNSARAEDPIITVSTRCWHRCNARINYFWKHKCRMKSLKHFQNQ